MRLLSIVPHNVSDDSSLLLGALSDMKEYTSTDNKYVPTDDVYYGI